MTKGNWHHLQIRFRWHDNNDCAICTLANLVIISINHHFLKSRLISVVFRIALFYQTQDVVVMYRLNVVIIALHSELDAPCGRPCLWLVIYVTTLNLITQEHLQGTLAPLFHAHAGRTHFSSTGSIPSPLGNALWMNWCYLRMEVWILSPILDMGLTSLCLNVDFHWIRWGRKWKWGDLRICLQRNWNCRLYYGR